MPSLFDIPEFKVGQDVRDMRDQLNRMRRAIKAVQPCDSADIKSTCTERGTTWRLAKKIFAGGSSPEECPFDITITETAGPVFTASFRPGTINQLLPSNYLTGVTVPETGTRYLVLSCTTSNGQITAAAFAADTTAPDSIVPVAGTPPLGFKVLIGVVIDHVATKVWGCGNIQVIPLEAFRLDKVSPLVGQLPYDVYYTWEFSLLG
jgi:hypothetical protein